MPAVRRYGFVAADAKHTVVERQGWINGVRWLNLLLPTTQLSIIVMSPRSELDSAKPTKAQAWARNCWGRMLHQL